MKFVAIAIATLGLMGSAQAADLLVKKSPPAPVAASTTCLEKNSLSNDTFGFTTGSDVNDVGALSLSGTYGLNLGTRAGNSNGHFGNIQATYSPYLCVEVDPYVFAGVTNSKSFGFSSHGSQYGAGVEAKYKILGRDTHGFGLTFDFIAQGAGTSGAYYTSLGGRSDNTWDTIFSVFADKELISGKLYGALNAGVDLNFTDLGGPRSGYDNTQTYRVGGALSYQVMDGLFLGVEGTHYRKYGSVLGFGNERGYANFLGPNFYWAFAKGWAFSGSFQAQVQGHSPRLYSGAGSDLDVTNFPHFQAKLKLNHDF